VTNNPIEPKVYSGKCVEHKIRLLKISYNVLLMKFQSIKNSRNILIEDFFFQLLTVEKLLI